MTIADVAAARRNQVPLGIAYMVGSTAMFAGGNAVVKWQLATYPLGEVAFGRTLFAFLTVAAIVLPRAGWGVWRTQRYPTIYSAGYRSLARGCAGSSLSACCRLARRQRSASRRHCSRPCCRL